MDGELLVHVVGGVSRNGWQSFEAQSSWVVPAMLKRIGDYSEKWSADMLLHEAHSKMLLSHEEKGLTSQATWAFGGLHIGTVSARVKVISESPRFCEIV